MDCYNNLELKYLTNSQYKHTLQQEKIKLHKDFDIYKDRIIKLTTLLSSKHELNKTLDKAFIEYTNICIDYLKDIDLNELVQDEYTSLPTKKKLTHVEPFDETINKTIFNHDKDKNMLEKFVTIKKSKEEIFLPEKKK